MISLPDTQLPRATSCPPKPVRDSMRTCVGCRARDRSDALVRFALVSHSPYVVPDIRGRLGGRGISVHPRRSCINAAVRTRGFSRALRRPLKLESSALCNQLVDMYRHRTNSLLLAARRSGQMALGADAVDESVDRRRAALIWIAEDASRVHENRYRERRSPEIVVLGTKESLGRLLGREEVALVSITHRGIADEIMRASSRIVALSEEP